MVFDGCSLTNDTGLAVADRYPSVVNAAITHPHSFYNSGIGGENIAEMAAGTASYVDPYYKSNRAHNICIPWAGTIELGTDGWTAQEAYDAYVDYCEARRAVGWQVVAVTALPRSESAAYYALRSTYNTLIRDNYTDFADALADVAADTTIGEDGDETNETYYRDKLHMTAAGYVIVAGIVQTAIETLL